LLNQRDWDDPQPALSDAAATAATDFKVDVPLAYMTLKEMLYSPLTLRIGRQPLWFGRGFIIGAKLRDPQGSISADEYTEMKNFDAVRATLDYDPWTLDMIYSKIEENFIQAGDDIDLYGINIGYLFDSYNAEAEGYWFYKNDKNNTVLKSNQIHTLGLRGSMDPIENLTVAAEGAVQLGRLVDPTAGWAIQNREREAFAADVMAEYRFVDYAWMPTIMGEIIYYSGNHFNNNTGAYEGWDPMYRGKFDTAIREFQGWMYLNDAFPAIPATSRTGGALDASFSNQIQFAVGGTIQPTDSLKVQGKYTHFRLDEPIAMTNTRKDVGDEVDIMFTYDYTEDVQFDVLLGWFMPGDLYPTSMDATATELMASVSVDF
jgi:hypothetical protein